MNTEIEQAKQEVERVRDVLAIERAALDQRKADVEAAEAATEEIPKLAAQAKLGEIEQAEADEQKAEIAARLDDTRAALEEVEGIVEEIERRVEQAGDEWAEAVRKQPVEAARAAEAEVRRLRAAVAAATRLYETRHAELREAERQASEIELSTREQPHTRAYALEQRHKAYSQATATLNRALRGDKQAQHFLRNGSYGDEFRERFEREVAAYEQRTRAAAEAGAVNAGAK